MKLSWIKLAYIAAKYVIITMREGYKRYPDERWKRQDLQYHARHASDHALHYHDDCEWTEDDIAHAITRCAMVKYLEGKSDTEKCKLRTDE